MSRPYRAGDGVAHCPQGVTKGHSGAPLGLPLEAHRIHSTLFSNISHSAGLVRFSALVSI